MRERACDVDPDMSSGCHNVQQESRYMSDVSGLASLLFPGAERDYQINL
jgi:hypothetical protein